MVASIVKFGLLLIFLLIGSAVHAQTNTFCAADVAGNATRLWVLQSTLRPNVSNGAILVDQQDGSTADAKFTAACRQLPATGGTLDARGFAATTQTLANPISWLTANGSSGGNIPIPVNFTTSSATFDNVTVTGMTGRGHCSLTPTNSSAATI